MGYIYADLVVRGRISKSIRALVNTGSAYVVLDPKTISEVGLHETPFEVESTLADKRRVKARLYLAEVEAEGRRGRLRCEVKCANAYTWDICPRNLRSEAESDHRQA
ncbi:hypothetical protein KEJ27_09405 [Candidatus Bathyarchaeota archaeon]|nr:hypothetical protein [Candidatus Bathyarchaeota archaeon]